MADKESTIYTHYGTIPTSERRDHKAAQNRARACHHFFLQHNACMNRHLRFGQEAVEKNCKELLDNWRRCFAGKAAQEDSPAAEKETAKPGTVAAAPAPTTTAAAKSDKAADE
eukprot:CAMPEP_0179438328 /NCGR_PEP_ID=MMETSP0799-20121207/22081_1 /TAXON_ID=46947 /ORGANISM="Geminigera cryophila, Strain CCMP2564" /LENGTH=112 /DNA_ID=CAMNT_0021219875 /DNA_START=12 /DNA_END=350 /DNA_ORIENTATION=-